jgi:hypothetical protein
MLWLNKKLAMVITSLLGAIPLVGGDILFLL